MEYARRLNGLDLFSGIGGFSLALQRYIKPIAYCENDVHAQSVLLSRMADGSLESAPIWDNITTLTGEHFNSPIDIITGGFPCQDISVAGNGKGLDGKRSGLFYEIVRLAKEIKPSFLFLENVSAIRTRGLDRIIEELTEIGYDCRWIMLSAANVGALHKRERWFLLAYSHQGRLSPPRTKIEAAGVAGENRKRGWSTQSRLDGMADGFSDTMDKSVPEYLKSTYWQAEPKNIPRVTQEKQQRVERIKRLGNSVVPLQALVAFEYLLNGKMKEFDQR